MNKINPHNILDSLPAAQNKEVFKVLSKGKGLKIERIVSCGQATPKDKWLCEKQSEWVILLKGKAQLSFKQDKRNISLKPGDYLFIPANTFHRVEWTSRRQKTVWLAVHFPGL